MTRFSQYHVSRNDCFGADAQLSMFLSISVATGDVPIHRNSIHMDL